MKNFLKILSLSLVLALLAGLLCGCGDEKQKQEGNGAAPAEAENEKAPASQQGDAGNTGIRASVPEEKQAAETVILGRYEQNGDPADGPEPVEWLILERDEAAGRALLLSRYALDCAPYSENADEPDEFAYYMADCSTYAAECDQYIAMAEAALSNMDGYIAQMETDRDLMISLGGDPAPVDELIESAKEKRSEAGTYFESMNSQYMQILNAIGGISAESAADEVRTEVDKIGSRRSMIKFRAAKIVPVGLNTGGDCLDAVSKLYDRACSAVGEASPDALLTERFIAADIPEFVPVFVDIPKAYSCFWEMSDLRSGLNGAFLNAVFTPQEQSAILVTDVINEPNPDHGTPAGNDCSDRLFLLSIAETNRYFPAGAVAVPTEYCLMQACKAYNAAMNTDTSLEQMRRWSAGGIGWWLRSPGAADGKSAAYVHAAGFTVSSGYDTGYGVYAVRPAMWVDLNKLQ